MLKSRSCSDSDTHHQKKASVLLEMGFVTVRKDGWHIHSLLMYPQWHCTNTTACLGGENSTGQEHALPSSSLLTSWSCLYTGNILHTKSSSCNTLGLQNKRSWITPTSFSLMPPPHHSHLWALCDSYAQPGEVPQLLSWEQFKLFSWC